MALCSLTIRSNNASDVLFLLFSLYMVNRHISKDHEIRKIYTENLLVYDCDEKTLSFLCALTLCMEGIFLATN